MDRAPLTSGGPYAVASGLVLPEILSFPARLLLGLLLRLIPNLIQYIYQQLDILLDIRVLRGMRHRRGAAAPRAVLPLAGRQHWRAKILQTERDASG